MNLYLRLHPGRVVLQGRLARLLEFQQAVAPPYIVLEASLWRERERRQDQFNSSMAFVLEPWEKYLRGLVGTCTHKINLKSGGGGGRDAALDLNVWRTICGKRTHSRSLAPRLPL